MNLQYLKHIDGIRGIAVILVCLYHLKIFGFAGGFIGVDIFFVLSGFLITRICLQEISQGKFSLLNFYIRRARRLLPALFLCILVSTLAGFFILTPSDFKSLAGSAVSGILFYANFYFYALTGYFDVEKEFKPLLHLWSLSVEEQFYMLWPFILLLGFRFKKLLFSISFFFIASLITAEYFLTKDPSLVFYMMPFRFFEFLFGAILANNEKYFFEKLLSKVKSPIQISLLNLFGFLLILIPLLTYDEKNFPGLKAILPCLGTTILIFAGGSNQIFGRFLHSSWLVFFGLISYSLYLLHWPVYVFWRYYWVAEPSNSTKIMLLVFSVAVSYLSYRFVEKPFRNTQWLQQKKIPKNFILSFSAVALLLISANIAIYKQDGWAWRVKGSAHVSEEYKKYFYTDMSCLPSEDKNQRFAQCSTEPFDFSSIGDSHVWTVHHFFHHLSANNQFQFGDTKYIPCRPAANCHGVYLETLANIKSPNIFMAFAWSSIIREANWNNSDPIVQNFLKKFKTDVIDYYDKRGQKLWVLGPMPLHELGLNICAERPNHGPNCSTRKLPNFEGQKEFNRLFKELVLTNHHHFADVFPLLCEDNGVCRTTYDDQAIYSDLNHYNQYNFGAYVMMKKSSKKLRDIFE